MLKLDTLTHIADNATKLALLEDRNVRFHDGDFVAWRTTGCIGVVIGYDADNPEELERVIISTFDGNIAVLPEEVFRLQTHDDITQLLILKLDCTWQAFGLTTF